MLTSTSGQPTTSSSTVDSLTSTSTGVDPGVCGDGFVDETEVCDDGNDDPDDGCDEQCTKTGAVEWTYTLDGDANKDDAALGVAIDSTGRIIVVGYLGDDTNHVDMLLLALAPDGTELWRTTLKGAAGLDDQLTGVVIGADDTIYVAGFEETMSGVTEAVVRAFDADGGERWVYSDPGPVAGFAVARGLTVTADALYTVGTEELLDSGAHLVVRRHDLATGVAAWKTPAPNDIMLTAGYAIVTSGPDLLAIGLAAQSNVTRPLIARFTVDGALVSTDIEDHPGGAWSDAAPIGDQGDLVLAGRRAPPGDTEIDVVVRRVGPDLSEKWSQTFDQELLTDEARGVAVGADEAIFAAGSSVKQGEGYNIYGARFASDGAPQWMHLYDNPDAHLNDNGMDAAFGDGFVILAGYETVLGHGTNVWIRRLKSG